MVDRDHGSANLRHIVPLTAVLWMLALSSASANEPSAAGLEFFEKNIRPIFVEHCYECHGGEDIKGGVRLNASAGWIHGGDSGPAVVAGKPDESLLVEAIRYGGNVEMPPTGKLPGEKIRLVEQWVSMGAPAPRESTMRSIETSIDIDAGRKFWAYQPVRDWPPPEVDTRGGSATSIDCFVLARLETAGVSPQPGAERTVLVRRLYFDLIGLPPTPEEIDRFLNDTSSNAYEVLVDRLLASPQFGERWGRHWLDVVRFAESLTLRGFILPEAWRYRDYVIESFGNDRPYDEFLRHQIAGDLLPADSVESRQRQLIATTFLALGNTNLEEQDKRQLDMDVVDEQLDVLGKAILGQTIGCARCHDHKFDPIPTRDYYALAGIFRNTQALEHENVSKWMEVPLPLPGRGRSAVPKAGSDQSPNWSTRRNLFATNWPNWMEAARIDIAVQRSSRPAICQVSLSMIAKPKRSACGKNRSTPGPTSAPAISTTATKAKARKRSRSFRVCRRTAATKCGWRTHGGRTGAKKFP